MKILQISTKDWGCGAEGSAWNLFRSYRERGHKSWLVVGRKLSQDPDVFEIPRKTALYQLLLPKRKVHGLWRLRKFLRFLSEVELALGSEDFDYPGSHQILDLLPERPDIVHAHNLHGGYFDLRFLTQLSRQVPVILNLRDMWLLTRHCAYSLECGRWKTGCGNCPDLSLYPAIQRDATAFNWHRKRRIYQHGRYYISTISQWLTDQVRDSMLHGVQYRMIPNAINLAVFQPGDQAEARNLLGLPVGAKIVLFSAHSSFKDDSVMQKAVGLLQMHVSEELLFICLGKSSEGHTLGQGRIIYPGFERDLDRMALYYRSSDVFIHAARAEAFGKTIVEAMACGTAVVATRTGGIPELIEDGVTGYLVPHGDSIAMSQRIQQLLDDVILRQQIGEQASAVALHRFQLKRQVDEFLDWYQEILDQEAKKIGFSNAH